MAGTRILHLAAVLCAQAELYLCLGRPRLACSRPGMSMPFRGQRQGPGAGEDQLKGPFFCLLALGSEIQELTAFFPEYQRAPCKASSAPLKASLRSPRYQQRRAEHSPLPVPASPCRWPSRAPRSQDFVPQARKCASAKQAGGSKPQSLCSLVPVTFLWRFVPRTACV